MDELFPDVARDYAWFALLASEPGDVPSTDPRKKAGLSHHLGGAGRTYMRSSWGSDAVWSVFQAGPRMAVDHQHQDQGHFEVWRGSDGLLLDGGGYGASATLNHNSLLIDDGGRKTAGGAELLPYRPSQGVWNKKVSTTHLHDAGTVLVAVGDLTDAWAPPCVTEGCRDRSVERAIRTFVYVRPDLFVIDDRVELAHGETSVVWAAHTRAPPKLGKDLVSATWGQSRLDITTLLPASAAVRAPKEPTNRDDHVYRANRPAMDLWRLEIVSPTGSKKRTLRHWLAAGDKAAPRAARHADHWQGAVGCHWDRWLR